MKSRTVKQLFTEELGWHLTYLKQCILSSKTKIELIVKWCPWSHTQWYLYQGGDTTSTSIVMSLEDLRCSEIKKNTITVCASGWTYGVWSGESPTQSQNKEEKTLVHWGKIFYCIPHKDPYAFLTVLSQGICKATFSQEVPTVINRFLVGIGGKRELHTWAQSLLLHNLLRKLCPPNRGFGFWNNMELILGSK